MSATLTVDPKKYTRLANRIVVKAIESEAEYDHMVAAVEQLMNKGEENPSPEESALLETLAILIQAHDDRHHLPPMAPNSNAGLFDGIERAGSEGPPACLRHSRPGFRSAERETFHKQGANAKVG